MVNYRLNLPQWVFLTLAFVLVTSKVSGQEKAKESDPIQTVGIKTNLLYDATATFNLGVELRTGHKTSLDISGNWNPFTFGDNRKWRHVLVQPEFRLWTKETFSGHFFGLHTHYGNYNVGNLPKPFSDNMRSRRYQGWLTGAGLSYGYRWNFNRNLGMEATIGVGYAYMDYTKYECATCGEKLGTGTKHYFGPTKAGITLIYTFGKKPKAAPAPVYIPPVVEKEPEPEVIVTYIPQLAASYTVPEAEAVKQRSESGKAYLDFAAGQSAVNPDYKNNAGELQKIYDLIASVRNNPDAAITGITITGYASPEGTYAANLTLSQKRALSLKSRIAAVTGYPDRMFTVSGQGEDWQTLDSLVSQSSMSDKYTILEIIRNTDIFDGRESKLMALAGGNPYLEMKSHLFPRLRRSDYQLHYTIQPFTVQQGKEVFSTRPANLSLNELFLIARTYEPGSDAFNEVFETAARLFPGDDTANLNAAASALSRKDITTAESYLSKVKAHTAAYHNNMGVLHGLKGQWEQSAEAFGRAKAAGDAEAGKNLNELDKRR